MKTFRMIGMALVAVMLSFTMSSCDNDDDEVNPYKDYPQLIVGRWFNFSPDASIFLNYRADGTYYEVGTVFKNGWREGEGTYEINGNIVKSTGTNMNNTPDVVEIVELTNDRFVVKPIYSEVKTNYRVKEQFDITGKYSYLNSAVRVVPAEGKTALQLPEGVTFNGQNSISIDAMHGDRIIDVMKKFFADATFAADGKLNHTMDGETKVKNYTLNGNNLVFNLYEGSDTYKVNATSFPDEDGDRLFIIIPKQAAWLGGMVDLVEKENEGLTLTEAQIAELEKEFMETFETFTVILSLSKK
ncbi:MAG: lipocalin family protein [Paludibacteraceae bacterium]|nr:lipocalin family protein [Paludibacteraceae bacterium]